jgi:hypothetical protein
MDDLEEAQRARRAEISYRNKRRDLEARDYKVMMLTFGILAYSGFSNLAIGIVRVFGGMTMLADAILSIVLGTLFAFGAYRVWVKDDTRAWVVLLPAVLSLALISLIWLVTGFPPLVPLILGVALLVLVPLRKKTSAALAAVPNNSFKPSPHQGGA